MFFIALASDYDGTLAHNGIVTDETVAALQQLRDSGRKLILVTGRELPDLKEVFPHIDLFDKVVAENGALLYTPASKEERALAAAPPPEFVSELEERGVAPLSVGRSIVATWEPHQATVLDVIRKHGLELEIIFNKGAVMVLPSGVNKATGLSEAVAELQLSMHNVVGIGDAENDHAFLKASGLSVAVDNAIPAVKETAQLVTRGARGAGVEELTAALIEREAELSAHLGVAIGKEGKERPVELMPQEVVLIAGRSGIGKSTLATALTERFIERKFQFCVFDPEGDYEGLQGAVTLGDGDTPPQEKQVLELLRKPSNNIVINTLALQLKERPDFFARLQPEITRLRARTARPHWLIIDEAHHLLPKSRDSQSLSLSRELPGTVLITVHPDEVAADALANVTAVLALGPQAGDVLASFSEAAGIEEPAAVPAPDDDHVLFWRPASGKAPRAIQVEKPRQSRKRHSRKYAEGELDEGASFYFTGPDGEMKLRAQNLMIFLQIAEGIDARTWEHHLRRGDYSGWFRRQLKDEELADEVAAIERDHDLPAKESRKRIAEAVGKRYTAPAKAKE